MDSKTDERDRDAFDSVPERRQYGPGPLPVKLSSDAPRGGKILDRHMDDRAVHYVVQVGEDTVHDVTLDEVLKYVSSRDLEEFEHKKFEEDQRILRTAKLAAREEELNSNEQPKQRAKTKGTVSYESFDDSDGSKSPAFDAVGGKYGRARPTYTHMFVAGSNASGLNKDLFTAKGTPRQRRRRRKRNPDTGDLMSLSDEDVVAAASSEDEPRTTLALDDKPKRRRRKRDPVTQKLLSLSPEPETSKTLPPAENFEHMDHRKRPRRRRHPRTQVLMPLGWRYNKNAPEERAMRATNEAAVTGVIPPSMTRLSIDQRRSSKRAKMTDESSSGSSNSQSYSQEQAVVLSTDEEDSAGTDETAPSALESSLGLRSGPEGAPVQTRNEKRNTTASIPRGARTDNEEGNFDETGEWTVDVILDHRLSKPKTHGPEQGKESIMLYKVRWEDGEVTWEPDSSFIDHDVVDDYHRHLGQRATQSKLEFAASKGKNTTARKSVSFDGNKLFEMTTEMDEESHASSSQEQDGEFEVEDILDHTWSDPRTHASDASADPVMLYLVKWKGYNEVSWEPATSFSSFEVIQTYRRKVGMPPLRRYDGMKWARD